MFRWLLVGRTWCRISFTNGLWLSSSCGTVPCNNFTNGPSGGLPLAHFFHPYWCTFYSWIASSLLFLSLSVSRKERKKVLYKSCFLPKHEPSSFVSCTLLQFLLSHFRKLDKNSWSTQKRKSRQNTWENSSENSKVATGVPSFQSSLTDVNCTWLQSTIVFFSFSMEGFSIENKIKVDWLKDFSL